MDPMIAAQRAAIREVRDRYERGELPYDAFRRETDPALKLKLFYRWMQMLRYETWMSRKFDRIVTMTRQDAAYLKSYLQNSDIRAIPIGIDPEEFAPLTEEPAKLLEVIFVGNFRHSPNVEAAEFLIGHIAPRFRGVPFTIPGSHVPDDFRKRAPAKAWRRKASLDKRRATRLSSSPKNSMRGPTSPK